MTRETLFRTDLSTQLASYTGWNSVFGTEIRTFAPSELPAANIQLSETHYTDRDSLGHPIAGEQDFVLTIIVAHTQLGIDAALKLRSDYLATLDTFFAGIYTTPSVTTGDPARIEAVSIKTIAQPAIRILDTRSTIVLTGSYLFTIL